MRPLHWLRAAFAVSIVRRLVAAGAVGSALLWYLAPRLVPEDAAALVATMALMAIIAVLLVATAAFYALVA